MLLWLKGKGRLQSEVHKSSLNRTGKIIPLCLAKLVLKPASSPAAKSSLKSTNHCQNKGKIELYLIEENGTRMTRTVPSQCINNHFNRSICHTQNMHMQSTRCMSKSVTTTTMMVSDTNPEAGPRLKIWNSAINLYCSVRDRCCWDGWWALICLASLEISF